MRTLLLVVVVLAGLSWLPLTAHAQDVPEPEQTDTKADQPADYCMLIFEGDGNPDKFVALDFGKGTKNKAYDVNQQAIVARIEKMTSVARAINYLSQKGNWDLHNTYATRDGNKVFHYYIFRRK